MDLPHSPLPELTRKPHRSAPAPDSSLHPQKPAGNSRAARPPHRRPPTPLPSVPGLQIPDLCSCSSGFGGFKACTPRGRRCVNDPKEACVLRAPSGPTRVRMSKQVRALITVSDVGDEQQCRRCFSCGRPVRYREAAPRRITPSWYSILLMMERRESISDAPEVEGCNQRARQEHFREGELDGSSVVRSSEELEHLGSTSTAAPSSNLRIALTKAGWARYRRVNNPGT